MQNMQNDNNQCEKQKELSDSSLNEHDEINLNSHYAVFYALLQKVIYR